MYFLSEAKGLLPCKILPREYIILPLNSFLISAEFILKPVFSCAHTNASIIICKISKFYHHHIFYHSYRSLMCFGFHIHCIVLCSGDDFEISQINVWPCCDLRKSWNFLRSYSTDCCWQYGRICWIVKFAMSIFIRSITSKISLTKIYKPIIINVLSLIVNDWKYA